MRWKRAAGRALLVCALLFAGNAGAQAGEPAGGPDGRGPITLVTGGDLTGYLRGVLDGWNDRHPHEKVTLVELPDAADEVRAQMVTELRSRSDRFDVLNIDVAWTSEFAAAGWIKPVNGAQFPLKRFLPPVVDTATFRGQLYAVPYVTNAGLLYYRKDVLDREGARPPRTWAELAHLAKTVAPKYGLDGYAGQFLPYEGLTANVVEAVQSAGGTVLAGEGARVTVDSPAARRGLSFLLDGVREGWIPRRALAYKEEESRKAFQDGRLLFLRNWPYAYALANAQPSGVAGKFGAVPLPGPDGPGSSALGGSNLAVNAQSRHQKTATELISYLTTESVQRRVLTKGALPPVWADLYTDPELVRHFPYLPTLKRAVLAAKPRIKSPQYDQVSLAVQAVLHDALIHRRSTDATVARLKRELTAIVGRG
ncbi:ABC transporter substrate-binding protein [Streptomyces nigrescens]|uniref:ABC transporter substrate-binding protein n=1 Tax=Streptomyces nigrescens TaxID=1920 RepID=A0A640TZ69_STRNI|nr:ABC transporter substrate-binding protein [Streptomyces libani]WAU01314.1 ABC transporter substrate-binding protein [Streptomyces libani subsp. libani]GFE27226.1 sugar ABC transporter substrate-binding protein [Streptomyces libani subsp. libani]GGV96717.1 sugar ABC transporter substrate-binding protein [Streptomyces libani subsp. libani]